MDFGILKLYVLVYIIVLFTSILKLVQSSNCCFQFCLLPKMEIKSENIELMTKLLKSYGRVMEESWLCLGQVMTKSYPSHDQVTAKSLPVHGQVMAEIKINKIVPQCQVKAKSSISQGQVMVMSCIGFNSILNKLLVPQLPFGIMG